MQGTVDAFRRIIAEEGIAGYYRGLGPSVSRAAVINGCGIASYDHTKQIVLRLTGQSDGLVPQVCELVCLTGQSDGLVPQVCELACLTGQSDGLVPQVCELVCDATMLSLRVSP